jgi:hypothetical protein
MIEFDILLWGLAIIGGFGVAWLEHRINGLKKRIIKLESLSSSSIKGEKQP